MEKTKLGISTCMLAAIAFLACFFGGYTPMILVVGYILIAEKDEWLRKNAITAVVVTIAFSFASSVVYLLPNLISFINTCISIAGTSFTIPYLSWVVNVITSALDLVERIFFLVMAVFALGHKTFVVPVVTDFIAKHLTAKED